MDGSYSHFVWAIGLAAVGGFLCWVIFKGADYISKKNQR